MLLTVSVVSEAIISQFAYVIERVVMATEASVLLLSVPEQIIQRRLEKHSVNPNNLLQIDIFNWWNFAREYEYSAPFYFITNIWLGYIRQN